MEKKKEHILSAFPVRGLVAIHSTLDDLLRSLRGYTRILKQLLFSISVK